jgi:hypothetical protein
MNCPKCQKTISIQARFCPYCQGRIPRVEVSEEPPNVSVASSRPQLVSQPASEPGNAFGILSSVTGFIGIFIFGGLLGAVAIILGILGLRQKQNDALSIIGIIIGSIEVICMGIYFSILLNAG